MMGNISIPKEWELAADQIQQDARTCVVIGRIDSGKSTFCKFLVHTWTASKICTGYVDSDLGQSTIGMPATAAVKIFKDPPKRNDYSNPVDMYFVGNTSPGGFLLQTLHAVKTMVNTSYQKGAEITLVDTTGFVDGPVARILKLHKIKMLCPEWIIALQAKDEIEHLLKGYEKMGWQIKRLTCSRQVTSRSQAERQKYRAEKYKAYFTGAKAVNYSTRRLVFPSCIIGTGQRINPKELPKGTFMHTAGYLYLEKCGSELLIIADSLDASIPLSNLKDHFHVSSVVFIERFGLKDLLVGLNDKDDTTLGLGIITDFDPAADTLTLITPIHDTSKVMAIHLGALKISHGEKELGRVRVIHYL